MQRLLTPLCFVLMLQSMGDGQNAAKPSQAQRPSARVGNLLVTVGVMSILAPEQYTPEHHYRLAIGTSIKNVADIPVCAVVEAKLETTQNVAEPVRIAVGDLAGPLRKLAPGESVGAIFEASVKYGADPLKLTIREEEPKNGCSDLSGLTSLSHASIPVVNVQTLRPIF